LAHPVYSIGDISSATGHIR